MKALITASIHQSTSAIIRKAIIGISLLVLFLPAKVRGQSEYSEYYGQNLRRNNIGMAVLGSWALANITVGAYGWSQHTGQQSYFHQMNFFWNTVNLSIAGFALYSNLTAEYAMVGGEKLLEMQQKTQRLYLINAAVDVGYVSTGFLLKYLSAKYPKNELRLQGYGNSVILQGSFLFLFDLFMYGLLRNHRADFFRQLSFSPLQDALGLGLTLQF